ncbi:MAG: hypothetical protein AAF485_25240 [Chloroflexota bacterium]
MVNRQVVTELGTGLIAEEAELMIVDEKIVWRIAIALSLPNLGNLGHVGLVEVDARTGNILTGSELQEKIIQHASFLYQGATL